MTEKRQAEKMFNDVLQQLVRQNEQEENKPGTDVACRLRNQIIGRMYMIAEGGDINRVDEQGRTLLWWGAAAGELGVLHAAIQQGANPNMAMPNGITQLHQAAIGIHDSDHDEPKIIQNLLLIGANPNLRDVGGNTPLDYAIFQGIRPWRSPQDVIPKIRILLPVTLPDTLLEARAIGKDISNHWPELTSEAIHWLSNFYSKTELP